MAWPPSRLSVAAASVAAFNACWLIAKLNVTFNPKRRSRID